MKDEIFKTEQNQAFVFSSAVAGVFDDMIARSVPFYNEIVGLSTDLACEYLKPNDKVYDLGCSTGATLLTLARKFNNNLELIGIDNAPAMLEKAAQKAEFFCIKAKFIEADIVDFEFEPCAVVFANFTMQFVRPLNRERVVKNIFDALNKNGIFLFAEKIISANAKLANILIKKHYNFKKKQGYSELEIMQKREALENVLVPYSQAENEAMVMSAGFSHVECVFRYLNFALFIAIKQN